MLAIIGSSILKSNIFDFDNLLKSFKDLDEIILKNTILYMGLYPTFQIVAEYIGYEISDIFKSLLDFMMGIPKSYGFIENYETLSRNHTFSSISSDYLITQIVGVILMNKDFPSIYIYLKEKKLNKEKISIYDVYIFFRLLNIEKFRLPNTYIRNEKIIEILELRYRIQLVGNKL